MTADARAVLSRLRSMRERQLWPNGQRYLWTDAFGVVLLTSLHAELGEARFLDEAEAVVADVDRVLGRPVGLRIGEAPDRDGQYFHYLAMWIFALWRLGAFRPGYAERALALARAIHPRFVVPDRGVVWKMREDLSAPYPGFGFGAIDPFHGYVVWRLVGAHALEREIAELRALVDAAAPRLHVTQDLGLGMLLWLSHFFGDERWAVTQRERALRVLDQMWIDPPGYFCREPGLSDVKLAFANYGVSLGLQAVGQPGERVARLQSFFDAYRSGTSYDVDAITHVMACTSRLPGLFLRSRS
ncbi:MAG TPA: hypothetical protein VF334_17260 [Polyangia bacterium]